MPLGPGDAPPFAPPITVDATDGRAAPRRGRGILANSVINLAGLVAAHALGAVSGLVTANVLGAGGVGVLAVVFGVIEFGRGLTNFTHGPSILEVHRGRDPDAVWGTSLILKFVGSALFVGLAALLSPALADLFDVPRWAVLLTSTLLVVGSFNEIGTARWEAENRMVERNLLVGLGPFVGLAAVGVFVLAGAYNVYTAILTSIIGTTAMSIGFAARWGRLRRLRWDGKVAGYLLRYGGKLVLTTFLSQALIWTDTLMVSAILGNHAAGIYNVVFQLTFVMVTGSVAIGIALLPAMSELAGRGEDTTHAYQRGTLLALALSLLIALGYVLVGRFVLSFYGPEFVAGYVPLLVLTLFGIAAALAVPAASVLTVHGYAGTLTLLSLAQAILNVPINYYFIQRWGILGASIATTSVFLVGIVATWLLVRRVTGAWPLSRQVFEEGWAVARHRLRGPRARGRG